MAQSSAVGPQFWRRMFGLRLGVRKIGTQLPLNLWVAAALAQARQASSLATPSGPKGD